MLQAWNIARAQLLAMRGNGGDGVRFLGKVLLLTLLCASGAWLFALIWAFFENGQAVDWDSPTVRALGWIRCRMR